MEIRINETNEIKEIEITDPKSNTSFIADLLGSHGADIDYDEEAEIHTMNSDDFDWWFSFCNDLQDAENEYYEIVSNHPESESLKNHVDSQCFDGCDLVDIPGTLRNAVNEWLSAQEY